MKDTAITICCVWYLLLSLFIITHPEWVGAWKAQVEFGFYLEATRLGMWSE